MTRQELDQAIQTITDFRKLVGIVNKEYQTTCNDVDYYTDEVIDITHDIEFSKLDRTVGSRKAKALQKVLRARREAKEIKELLSLIKTFANENVKYGNELSKLINALSKMKNEQQNRVYSPRTGKTIEVAYKHFDKETEECS